MSKEGQERITFRTSAKTRAAIEQLMGEDGSRSMNEFIEHAVIRYIDQILMSKSTTLPKAISSAIDGRLDMLEDRLSALQFNNSVELDMLVQIIAGEYNLDPGYLRKLRSKSVKNVKQTSGRVSLASAVKESDQAEWQG